MTFIWQDSKRTLYLTLPIRVAKLQRDLREQKTTGPASEPVDFEQQCNVMLVYVFLPVAAYSGITFDDLRAPVGLVTFVSVGTGVTSRSPRPGEGGIIFNHQMMQ
jgi:hypothetical protein